MTKSNINELIAKYLSGEISDIEQEALNEWRTGSEKNEAIFEGLTKIWEENSATPELLNSEALIDKIWNTAKENETHKIKKHYSWDYMLKIAASILIVISVAFVFYQNLEVAPENIAENSKPERIIKENPIGQKVKMYLPDGTIVWLNSATTLEYDSSYNQSDRKIKLEGEAFFEVAEDKNKPFVVESGNLMTTALGTSFNINAYPDNENIGVSLVSGKVKVENINNDQEKEVILQPGYELIHDVESSQYLERAYKPIDVVGWKDGILSFKRAGYKETIKKLERWFGVEIKTEGNPPNDWSLTTYYREESLMNIIKNIQFGKKFDYELKKDLLVIKFH